jgi:myo-inositol-1(or 4)-monophosphatase
MKKIEAAFCGELLKRVGEGLQARAKLGAAAAGREALFGRFAEANGWAQEEIRVALAAEYPEVRWSDSEFDYEEQRQAEFAGGYWICDPIDGAVQYLQGMLGWSISLCLIQDGEPQLAMVYEPCKKELFHAVAGEGTYCNGTRVAVSEKRELAEAFVSTSQPSFVTDHVEDTRLTTGAIAAVMPNVFAVRMMGAVSLQMAYVASGRLDGYWEFGYDMYDWLAGALLVREAGGVLTDLDGEAFAWGKTGVVAGNEHLQEALRVMVGEVRGRAL